MKKQYIKDLKKIILRNFIFHVIINNFYYINSV